LRGARRRIVAVAAAAALLAGACASDGAAPRSPAAAPPSSTSTTATTATTVRPAPTLGERALVGAYYYLWNPENLDQGTLREALVPPQPDARTQSSSSDGGVAQDIADAAAHGVDFFAVDWWPRHPERNRRLDDLLAANHGDVRFCIFYELEDLGFDVATGTTMLGPRQIATFTRDLDQLAARYVGRPDYLRVGGRPVVILYLTRTLVGDVAGAIRAARSTLAARGEDVLLIGDEIFWSVAPLGRQRARPTTAPQVDRVRMFDAITAYNLYDGDHAGRGGYGSTSTFVADSNALIDRYREATDGAVPIVPSVIPGFNDRGVRPRLRHPVVPRPWSPRDAPTGLFAHLLDDVAIPHLDERLPMVLVTSWNEWNEDTAIEPTDVGPPATARDGSRTGAALTGGFAYAPNGTAFVEVLQDRFGPRAGKDPPWPRTR
jgi:hypothetical protein